MTFLKKYLGFVVGLAVVALLVMGWEETAKITGEVSASGSTGNVVPLAGARVTLYKMTEEQEQRLSASLASFEQQNQQEKDANARVYPAESKDEMVRSNLANFNNLSDTKLCFALEKALDEVSKLAVRKETADSQGRFAFRALPGHYVLEVISQANSQYTEFVELVEPKWHTHFKLVEPTCRYSLAN